VELRFDSLPSGGVYADGHSAELCRTPCSFDVDPADGGPKRTYVVRSDGYADKSIDVDLASSERVFHVTLERVVAEPAAKPVAKVVKKPAEPAHKAAPAEKPADNDSEIDPADTHDPFKHH